MVYATAAIAFLGFGVWAHHMFTVGMGPTANAVFAGSTMLIAIPTGVKIFNWMGTMYKGSLRFTTAMLFAVGLVSQFVIGGLSGVMHASPAGRLTAERFLFRHRAFPLCALSADRFRSAGGHLLLVPEGLRQACSTSELANGTSG